MKLIFKRLAQVTAATVLIFPGAHAAIVDLGWDASSEANGALNTWAANTNNYGGTVMTWNGSGTKSSGSSNLANVNDWVSSPDYTLTGGGGDSWHDGIGDAATKADASWEWVIRPGSFTGNRHLYNTGGNGSGLAFLLEGSSIRFIFQSANDNNRRIDLSFDLATVGTANDFFHIVGTNTVTVSNTGTGELWVNGQSVAGPTTTVGDVLDWDGSDTSALGSAAAEVHNIPSSSGYTSDAFNGDLALFNFYEGEILNQTDVTTAYNGLVPEPSTSLLALCGCLGLLIRRR